MKIVQVTMMAALALCAVAIDVRLGAAPRGAIGPQGKVAQFPGAPQQMVQQQAAPQQFAAAPQQIAPQQAAPQQPSGFGGFGGFGGFNLGNFGNAASKFIGETPSFDDLLNKAQASAPAAPAAPAPANAQLGANNGKPLAANGPAAPALNAAPAAPQARNAPAFPGQGAPVAEAPRMVGGFNNVDSCASVGQKRTFANLDLVKKIVDSFNNGQASGATVLKLLSTQVVAGFNHKIIFNMDGAFLGIALFEGLGGAAPVIKRFFYSENLGEVLDVLNINGDAKADLNCKVSDVADGVPQIAPKISPMAPQAAPQAAPRAPQAAPRAPQAAPRAPPAPQAAPQAAPQTFQAPQAPQQPAALAANGFNAQGNAQAPQFAPRKPQQAPQQPNLAAQKPAQQTNFAAQQPANNFAQPGLNSQPQILAAPAAANAPQQFANNQQAFSVPTGATIINIGSAQNV